MHERRSDYSNGSNGYSRYCSDGGSRLSLIHFEKRLSDSSWWLEIHLELMGTIRDLPTLDRPREKALRYGIDELSDAELIALIIGSGYHGENVNEVANKLLSTYNGLKGLSLASIPDMSKLKGIKTNKALLLAAIFEIHKRLNVKSIENEESQFIDSDYLYQKYSSRLENANQEVLILVLVNKRRNIIREATLYKGTENDVIFSYKEMWRELFIHNAYGFYLIHNHPNNLANPSKKDILFTGEIIRESRRIRIPLIDHLIIGDDGYYSFEKNKKIMISC